MILSADQIIDLTEACIKDLITSFLDRPYVFYTESDMHCHLYSRMYSSGLNAPCLTGDGKQSTLLHKEYPTKKRYNKRELKEDPKGRRGHYDLSVWNPDTVEKLSFRSNAGANDQNLIVAIELSLDEDIDHLKWDLLKLSEKDRDRVQHGYILFFIRDHPCSLLNQLITEPKVRDETAIKILYAEKRAGEEPITGTVSNNSFRDLPNLAKKATKG